MKNNQGMGNVDAEQARKNEDILSNLHIAGIIDAQGRPNPKRH